MKKYLKYWAIILIFNYGLTIGLQYLLRPFSFLPDDLNSGLASTEMLVTIFILPITLLIINYWLARKHSQRRFFIINSIIIYSCILISAQLGFFNWADSVGSRIHPDKETLLVVNLEKDLGLIVTTIGLIIAFLGLYRKRKVYSYNSDVERN